MKRYLPTVFVFIIFITYFNFLNAMNIPQASIDSIITQSQEICISNEEALFLSACDKKIESLPKEDRGIALAASFDLLVSAEYYSRLLEKGWLYCDKSNRMLMPYLNACPVCSTQPNPSFFHHRAAKPSSGAIGKATTRAIGVFLKNFFGNNINVYTAKEPIDMILEFPKEKTCVVGEVKSAPLLTLPLASSRISKNKNSHERVEKYKYNLDDLYVYLPSSKGGSYYPFRMNATLGDLRSGAIFAFAEIIDKIDFFAEYLAFWKSAFSAYKQKNQGNPYFWLTSACGSPKPTPQDWPTRSTDGKETISDAKTSFGLDRTDDIKKATYQALKLRRGISAGETIKKIKVSIISNAYAERHEEEYINPISDIVWMVDSKGTILAEGDFIPQSEVFNLFDGIITFTRQYARDAWIKSKFEF